jgi:hypothetical protein
LDGWADPLLGGSATSRSGGVCGPDEVVEVGSFGFVELQGAGDAFEDVIGDAAGVTPLRV